MLSARLAVLTLGFSFFACGIDTAAPVVASADAPLDTVTPRIAVRVSRTNLVSDQEGAKTRDPLLVNAWGLAFSPRGIAFVSAAGTGVAAAYSSTGERMIEDVKLPLAFGLTGTPAPTGQVFNADPGAFMGDQLIFVTEEGTLIGWQPNGGAAVRVTLRDTHYTGATLASLEGQTRLYATDFHGGRIDVFDPGYVALNTEGGFVMPSLPAGFAPFNIQEVEGGLVVTYALQDEAKQDAVKGVGNGLAALFDTDGHFLTQLGARGQLNAPWGVAMAPIDAGRLSRRLLIGNFGDGRINIFRLDTPPNRRALQATFEGALEDLHGRPLAIDGLWALRFGVGASGFDSHALYFTAGPSDEQHGVFGALRLGPPQNPSPR